VELNFLARPFRAKNVLDLVTEGVALGYDGDSLSGCLTAAVVAVLG
jgi:hypothetical protein